MAGRRPISPTTISSNSISLCRRSAVQLFVDTAKLLPNLITAQFIGGICFLHQMEMLKPTISISSSINVGIILLSDAALNPIDIIVRPTTNRRSRARLSGCGTIVVSGQPRQSQPGPQRRHGLRNQHTALTVPLITINTFYKWDNSGGITWHPPDGIYYSAWAAAKLFWFRNHTRRISYPFYHDPAPTANGASLYIAPTLAGTAVTNVNLLPPLRR
jgi:hypothetical protein